MLSIQLLMFKRSICTVLWGSFPCMVLGNAEKIRSLLCSTLQRMNVKLTLLIIVPFSPESICPTDILHSLMASMATYATVSIDTWSNIGWFAWSGVHIFHYIVRQTHRPSWYRMNKGYLTCLSLISFHQICLFSDVGTLSACSVATFHTSLIPFCN